MMARAKQPKTCKHCGRTGLFWQSFDGSWVLANTDGARHRVDGRCISEGMHVEPKPVPTNYIHVPAIIPRATEGTCMLCGEPFSNCTGPDHCEHNQRAKAVKAAALLNTPVVIDTPRTTPIDASDAGATLYALVRPHAVADVQDTITAAVKAAMAGFEPTAQVTPLSITIAATDITITVKTPHKQLEKLIRKLAAGLNVLAVGPAGSGKTQACEDAAKALNIPFYPQSVGAQTSKSDLVGYMDAHGKLVRTIFREAYENGGLFLLDEVDAGNANVLTILNAALANGYCAFPDGVVKRHEGFHCVAAANTFGNGANRQYVGRNQLDAATLNRFVKMAWEYDETLEAALGASQHDWTRYIHRLRAAAESTGVRVILSTRDIMNGTRLLAAGFDREETEQAVLWAGMAADDRAKLCANL